MIRIWCTIFSAKISRQLTQPMQIKVLFLRRSLRTKNEKEDEKSEIQKLYIFVKILRNGPKTRKYLLI